MVLFITGAILLIIMLLASIGAQFFGITFVYDAMAAISNLLGIRLEVIQRMLPLLGTILLVIGYVQINRAKDSGDQ